MQCVIEYEISVFFLKLCDDGFGIRTKHMEFKNESKYSPMFEFFDDSETVIIFLKLRFQGNLGILEFKEIFPSFQLLFSWVFLKKN